MGVFSRLVAFGLPVVPKPIVRRVAQRYVAGDDLEAGLRAVEELNREGATTTVSLLGEEVADREAAKAATQESEDALIALEDRRLDGNVSVKPTHVGLRVSEAICFENLEHLVRTAKERDNSVRIDMEDRSTTDATLRMYRTLHERYGNVGVVLQAYMRRTLSDVAALPEGANVRLCKGIYIEPRPVAWKGYDTIRLNFMAALERLVDRGAYVAVATHDEFLVCAARALFERRGLDRDRYEFQTLLGVDEELRRILIAEGHRLRVYVPYGVDWYSYSLRRLRENPEIAMHVMRGMVGRR